MHNIISDENLTVTNKIINAICQLEDNAFNILLSNPGYGKKELMNALMKNHKDLIIEAYGNQPDDIVESLMKLWDTSYCDIVHREEHTFKEWAIKFSSVKDTELYKEFTEVYQLGNSLGLL